MPAASGDTSGCRSAMTGQEAFEAINEEAFDCAFVDLRLPGHGRASASERDKGARSRPAGGHDERLSNLGLHHKGHAQRALLTFSPNRSHSRM